MRDSGIVGYCCGDFFQDGDSVFSAEDVIGEMSSFSGKADIIVKEETGSTNDDAKALAAKGAPEGTAVIAGSQTNGRGRLGRSFYSPADTGLYLSIVIRPETPAAESAFVTVCAACAVSAAIDEVCGVKTGIKWVNDIFCNGKKVCGILAESAMEGMKTAYSVVGIGVNISTKNFPAELTAAGSLGAVTDIRAKLAGKILDRFFEFCKSSDRRECMRIYREKSVLDGKTVTLTQGKETFVGTVTGTDDEARLLLRLPDGSVKAFSSGEASIGSAGL